MLIDNPRGGYRFLTGISPFSSGVVASDGHEVVHATPATPPDPTAAASGSLEPAGSRGWRSVAVWSHGCWRPLWRLPTGCWPSSSWSVHRWLHAVPG